MVKVFVRRPHAQTRDRRWPASENRHLAGHSRRISAPHHLPIHSVPPAGATFLSSAQSGPIDSGNPLRRTLPPRETSQPLGLTLPASPQSTDEAAWRTHAAARHGASGTLKCLPRRPPRRTHGRRPERAVRERCPASRRCAAGDDDNGRRSNFMAGYPTRHLSPSGRSCPAPERIS
jgi:hypothetical protein